MTSPALVAFDLDDTLAPSKEPIDARMVSLPVSYTHLTLPTNA